MIEVKRWPCRGPGRMWLMLLPLGLAGGCESSPPPPPVPEMVRFADDTAKSLARDIIDNPDIKGLDEKGVLELGGLENQSKAIPNEEFMMVQNRVQSDILRSQDILNVMFPIEDAGTMAKEFDRSQGKTTDDPLQDANAAPPPGIAKYNPENTFILRGKLFEADRDHKAAFYFRFTLIRLASRKLVFEKDYLYQPPK